MKGFFFIGLMLLFIYIGARGQQSKQTSYLATSNFTEVQEIRFDKVDLAYSIEDAIEISERLEEQEINQLLIIIKKGMESKDRERLEELMNCLKLPDT